MIVSAAVTAGAAMSLQLLLDKSLERCDQTGPALTVSRARRWHLQQTTVGDLHSRAAWTGRQFPSHDRFVRRILVPAGKPGVGQRTRRIDFEDFAVMLKFAEAAIGILDAFFVRDELPFSSRARVHLPNRHLEVAAGAPLHSLVAINERLENALGRRGNLDFADNSIL